YCAHPALHSFPTRRSSDLITTAFCLSICSFSEIRSKLFCKNSASASCRASLSLSVSGAFNPMAKATTIHSIRVCFILQQLVPQRWIYSPKKRLRSDEHMSELQLREKIVCSHHLV